MRDQAVRGSALTDPHPHTLGVLAKLVIALAVLLILAGALWHGVSVENTQRIWRNIIERPSGPMSFRFILQPSVAAVTALFDGLKDARTGRSPYFWTVLRNPQERGARLREGLSTTARIVLLGIAIDVIYQAVVLKAFYPVEALIVALLLAFLPYLLIRGPVARIAGRWRLTHAAPRTWARWFYAPPAAARRRAVRGKDTHT